MKGALIVVLVAMASCNPWRGWESADAELSTPAAIEVHHGVVLPGVSAPEAQTPSASPRIVVREDRLLVETTAVWRAMPPAAREIVKERLGADAEPFIVGPEPRVIALGKGRGRGPTIDIELGGALQSLSLLRREIDRLRDAIDPGQSEYDGVYEVQRALGGVVIIADRGVSVELVKRVITCAAQAQMSTFEIAVAHEGQLRALPIEAPRYCAAPNPTPTRTPLSALLKRERCLSYAVTDTRAGWHVALEESRACGAWKPLVGEAAPKKRDYHGQTVRGPEGQCPAIPRGDPSAAKSALDRALALVHTRDPVCRSAFITISRGTDFEALVTIMGALSARGFKSFQLGYGEPMDPGEVCAEGAVAPGGIKGRRAPAPAPDRKPR